MNVLIVGLRNKDISRLKTLKNLKIFFVTSDNISNKTLKNCNRFDVIINVCKFSTHLTEYMCNSHSRFIRLRPTQGISTVNNLLGTLCNESLN